MYDVTSAGEELRENAAQLYSDAQAAMDAAIQTSYAFFRDVHNKIENIHPLAEDEKRPVVVDRGDAGLAFFYGSVFVGFWIHSVYHVLRLVIINQKAINAANYQIESYYKQWFDDAENLPSDENIVNRRLFSVTGLATLGVLGILAFTKFVSLLTINKKALMVVSYLLAHVSHYLFDTNKPEVANVSYAHLFSVTGAVSLFLIVPLMLVFKVALLLTINEKALAAASYALTNMYNSLFDANVAKSDTASLGYLFSVTGAVTVVLWIAMAVTNYVITNAKAVSAMNDAVSKFYYWCFSDDKPLLSDEEIHFSSLVNLTGLVTLISLIMLGIAKFVTLLTINKKALMVASYLLAHVSYYLFDTNKPEVANVSYAHLFSVTGAVSLFLIVPLMLVFKVALLLTINEKALAAASYALTNMYNSLFDANVAKSDTASLVYLFSVTGAVTVVLWIAMAVTNYVITNAKALSAMNDAVSKFYHWCFSDDKPLFSDKEIHFSNLVNLTGLVTLISLIMLGIAKFITLLTINKNAVVAASYALTNMYNNLFNENVAKQDAATISFKHLFSATGLVTVGLWIVMAVTNYFITNAKALSAMSETLSEVYKKLFNDSHTFFDNKDTHFSSLINLTGLLTAICAAGLLVGYVLKVVANFIGFSAYAGHQTVRTLKICSNFLLGTQFDVAGNETAMQNTENKNSISAIGSRYAPLPLLLKGCLKLVTGFIAFIGLSAGNWHQLQRWYKLTMNRSNHESKQVPVFEHNDFLHNAKKDVVSKFLVEWNLLAIAAKATSWAIRYPLMRILLPIFVYAPARYVVKCIAFVLGCVWSAVTFKWCRSVPGEHKLVAEVKNFKNHLECQPRGGLPNDDGLPTAWDLRNFDEKPGKYVDDMKSAFNRMKTEKVSWSRALIRELRQTIGFGGLLGTKEERIVDKIEKALRQYFNENADGTAADFFKMKYPDVVARIKANYIRDDDKLIVDRIAYAVQEAVLSSAEEYFSSSAESITSADIEMEELKLAEPALKSSGVTSVDSKIQAYLMTESKHTYRQHTLFRTNRDDTREGYELALTADAPPAESVTFSAPPPAGADMSSTSISTFSVASLPGIEDDSLRESLIDKDSRDFAPQNLFAARR